jgi:hypothetical protein
MVPLDRRTVTMSLRGRTAPLSQVRGERPASPLRACWRHLFAWGWRIAGKRRPSSSQTRGQCPACPPLGHRRRRLAQQPTWCRLLLGHGCPASFSCGEEGDGTNPNVVLPPWDKTSSIPPPPGGLTAVVVVVARRRKEYHVVAAVEGHELETPETDQHLGLKRLLETTHLELDGKLFVNTQQALTWRANCRRFDLGGSLDRRVNCRCVSQPRWVGARWNTRGEREPRLVLSCAQGGCACSRGLQAFARERACPSARPPARPPFSYEGPGPSFYRCKERVQVYNGGCSNMLTCPVERSQSPMYMPTWLLERS